MVAAGIRVAPAPAGPTTVDEDLLLDPHTSSVQLMSQLLARLELQDFA